MWPVIALHLSCGKEGTIHYEAHGSEDSSVSTVTTLRAGGPRHCGTFPFQSKSSVVQSTKISHKAHSDFYSVSVRVFFPREGVQVSICEIICSPPSGDIRNEWSLTSTLHYFLCFTEGKLNIYTILKYFIPNFIVWGGRGLCFLMKLRA
jgi:hypothetical protein